MADVSYSQSFICLCIKANEVIEFRMHLARAYDYDGIIPSSRKHSYCSSILRKVINLKIGILISIPNFNLQFFCFIVPKREGASLGRTYACYIRTYLSWSL